MQSASLRGLRGGNEVDYTWVYQRVANAVEVPLSGSSCFRFLYHIGWHGRMLERKKRTVP